LPTGIGEFDRALGGGLVSGGVVLIGGDPGIGKSTCCCRRWPSCPAHNVLYVSGEESGQQIAMRARRLALDTAKLQTARRDQS
jgi:DNA repair protein RadA/Sms